MDDQKLGFGDGPRVSVSVSVLNGFLISNGKENVRLGKNAVRGSLALHLASR